MIKPVSMDIEDDNDAENLLIIVLKTERAF